MVPRKWSTTVSKTSADNETGNRFVYLTSTHPGGYEWYPEFVFFLSPSADVFCFAVENIKKQPTSFRLRENGWQRGVVELWRRPHQFPTRSWRGNHTRARFLSTASVAVILCIDSVAIGCNPRWRERRVFRFNWKKTQDFEVSVFKNEFRYYCILFFLVKSNFKTSSLVVR